MTWRRLWIAAAATVAGGLALVALAVALIDPLGNIGLLPGIDRQPMSRDKRFSTPGLARQARFDSLIIGTSTVRLLRPSYLGPALDASFANLSLDGSLPAEHVRSLRYFLKHHPRPKVLIAGIDPGLWCVEDVQPEPRRRAMPDLLYDDNRWNDVPHMLNWQVLRLTGEQLLYLVGASDLKWGKDGYTPWPQTNRYDPARAEALIYPRGRGVELENPIVPREPLLPDRRQWRYDNHAAWLQPLLALPPAETLKILMIPPAHRVSLSPPGSPGDLRLAECKRRIAVIAACAGVAHLVDFAFESDITRHDRNFWDPTHVTIEVAERVQTLLVEAVKTRRSRNDLYRSIELPGPILDRAVCKGTS